MASVRRGLRSRAVSSVSRGEHRRLDLLAPGRGGSAQSRLDPPRGCPSRCKAIVARVPGEVPVSASCVPVGRPYMFVSLMIADRLRLAFDARPTHAKKSGACSARVVDLGDEIEEAGKVSELTVEAQGGITVNTDTKDGDSGAGIEA